MKVIDLLVKIANGEDVPKRIICNKLVYELKEKCYVDYCGETLIGSLCFDGSNLNDEIEIIEDTPKEDKKITKIKSLNKVGWSKDIIELGDKQQLNNQILKVTFIDKTTLFVEGTLKIVVDTNNEKIIKAIQYLKDNREYQEDICDECIAILKGEE